MLGGRLSTARTSNRPYVLKDAYVHSYTKKHPATPVTLITAWAILALRNAHRHVVL